MEDSVLTNKSKNNTTTIALVIVLIVAIVAFAIIVNSRDKENNEVVNIPEDDISVDQEVDITNAPNASVDLSSSELMNMDVADTNRVKVVIPGTNPINENNRVVTEDGRETENDALPMSENAPKQSRMLNKEDLPEQLVNINIGNGIFEPRTFITSAGAPTAFALTGADDKAHIISFDDASLQAVAILVGPGQTKAINFNAPKESGTYTFSCAYHSDEVGEMIVN